MEFFGEAGCPGLNVDELKALLTIGRLPALCKSVTSMITDEGVWGGLYSVWGEFAVSREEIRYGIRFSLPGCPARWRGR